MTKPLETYVTLHHLENGRQLAQVVLNGYNIEPGGPLGHSGAMRSFKLLEGDLWDEWDMQATLLALSQSGRESRVRVAALPAESGSFGFIEFL